MRQFHDVFEFARHADSDGLSYGTVEPGLDEMVALVLWIHELTVGIATLHVVEAKDGAVLLLPPIFGSQHQVFAFLQSPRVIQEAMIPIIVLTGVIVLHFQGSGVWVLFPVDQLLDPFHSKRLEGKQRVPDCPIEGSTVQEVHKHAVGDALFEDVGFVSHSWVE